MAESIVGIDINGSSVRIVRLTTGSRRVLLSEYAVAEAPAGADFKQLAALTRKLIDDNGLVGDAFVVALAADLAYVRRFAFPFASVKKIEQVLPYEMEPQLPCSLQDVVVAHRQAFRSRDGFQTVIAAALPKAILTELLGAFASEGLELAEVGLGIDALDFLAGERGEDLPPRCLWLDIGRTRTQVLYLEGGMPVCFRSIPWGCGELASRTGEGPTAGACQQENLDRLVSEVMSTVLAARPERVRLPGLTVCSGSGADYDGLLAVLGQRFQGPVRRLSDFSWKRLEISPEIRGRMAILAVATAAAWRKAAGAGRLDFLRGEFAVKPVRNHRRRARYVLAAAFALALASFVLSVGMDLRAKAKRLEFLEDEARRLATSILPDVGNDLNLRQYIAVIKERTKRLEEKKALRGQKAPETNFVETLRLVSSAVGSQQNIVFKTLDFDGNRVRIKAEADTFETIESIKKQLIAAKVFREIQIKDIKSKSGANGKEFHFELVR